MFHAVSRRIRIHCIYIFLFTLSVYFPLWSGERPNMCKSTFYRFACTEASAGRDPQAVRRAAGGDSDRHSAGPPVGHVCSEAQRHEGGRHRRPQGTANSSVHKCVHANIISLCFDTSSKTKHLTLFSNSINITKCLCLALTMSELWCYLIT